jgi:hypothetical protein
MGVYYKNIDVEIEGERDPLVVKSLRRPNLGFYICRRPPPISLGADTELE